MAQRGKKGGYYADLAGPAPAALCEDEDVTMEQHRASRTAEMAAATRAWHDLSGNPRVFADPWAVRFVGPLWRSIVRLAPLRWLVFERDTPLRPVAGQVVVRSRYCEDALTEAMDAGVRQYVIVGAGFDSFALRRPELADTLRIFELDHPATQRAKRARLSQLIAALPAHLELVPVDFESEGVGEALARTRFDGAQPAFFSWLGTTPYLSNTATLSTLAAIASVAAPSSEIVFDYLVPPEQLRGEDRKLVEDLRRFTAKRGEPLVGEFAPEVLRGSLEQVGLRVLEDLSADAQAARYFAGRDDGLRPMAASRLVRAVVTD